MEDTNLQVEETTWPQNSLDLQTEDIKALVDNTPIAGTIISPNDPNDYETESRPSSSRVIKAQKKDGLVIDGQNNNENILILGFVVTAGFLVVLNLVLWTLLAKKPDYGLLYRILAPLVLIGDFVLIARTLIKSETARITCLLGAVGVLFFALISSYDFVRNYHDNNQTQQNIITQSGQLINTYKSDNLVTASEKASIVSELKKTESLELQKLSTKNTVLPLVTIYLLMILPIVFLERTDVKKSFT